MRVEARQGDGGGPRATFRLDGRLSMARSVNLARTLKFASLSIFLALAACYYGPGYGPAYYGPAYYPPGHGYYGYVLLYNRGYGQYGYYAPPYGYYGPYGYCGPYSPYGYCQPYGYYRPYYGPAFGLGLGFGLYGHSHHHHHHHH
jgi:hypothetical protein